MRDISGLLGAVYSATEWIMRFSISNLLWFFINLPIVIIIYSTYSTGFSDGFFIYLLPLVLLVPVLFVPSTIALFATAREWVMQKDQHSLVKVYFKLLSANYKQSLFSGIALTIIWIIWLVDFTYFMTDNDLLTMLFLLFGILLFVFTINFFMLSVHFQMNTKELMKNAFHVTLGKPLFSLFILISNTLLVYISLTSVLFMIPFFIGSLSAYLSFVVFYRFTVQMEKRVEGSKSN